MKRIVKAVVIVSAFLSMVAGLSGCSGAPEKNCDSGLDFKATVAHTTETQTISGTVTNTSSATCDVSAHPQLKITFSDGSSASPKMTNLGPDIPVKLASGKSVSVMYLLPTPPQDKKACAAKDVSEIAIVAHKNVSLKTAPRGLHVCSAHGVDGVRSLPVEG
jgi:hypothetical protein